MSKYIHDQWRLIQIDRFNFRSDAELDILDRSKVEELRTGEEWFGENSNYRNMSNPCKLSEQ